ncbi:UNC-like C-terminal-domain-containing protein [Cristinia sonorae]|uniref:UNC-like C-terminal-domain-containing protein n=1 Tax=Cristinia sonorae TaxID=1940300 RepID=A0A8K0UGI4_9AGAR|nr:UNC-like C-terminal-domain-containing protein [Cristinia sonorae]
MFSNANLPLALLVLLATVIPALSASTTPYDPFHDIAIHAQKAPEQPVCCLRPLTPLDESEEEVLLTFEEWKAKRLAEVKDTAVASHPLASNGHKPGSTEDVQDPAPAPSGGEGNAASGSVPVADTSDIPPERLSPHFRIPIHDRFNYASMDCSARVHNAHKSAKSASSILSSKKDRYMLSPCAEKQRFVVVELCDDIRIDTVQLANYEFFSGVFKDFSVSVAKTYTGGWVPAGSYTGKNTRGLQSFHTPQTLSDFYRFIRIDFHSHYGNEYYCPLSLLRVYGLTHLEQWKWDLWEDESRRRAVEAAATEILNNNTVPQVDDDAVVPENALPPTNTSSDVEADAEPPSVPVHEANLGISATTTTNTISSEASSLSPHEPVVTFGPQPATTPTVTSDAPSPSPDNVGHLVGQPPADAISESPQSSQPTPTEDKPLATDSASTSQTVVTVDSPEHSSAVVPTISIPATSAIPSPTNLSSSFISHISRNTTNGSASAQNTHSIRSSSSSSTLPVHTVHSVAVIPPSSTGGESIYRIIMNRLTALEANTTLYARYVEEQIAGVREMMRRLGEDVGRLESIGKAQAQMYQRSVLEFERHRKRLDLEHVDLIARLNQLNDQVMHEKRLGIAQLCMLLTVLIFMALTRGSKGEVVHPPDSARSRTNSMRAWGKRTLSLSGLSVDLMNKFRSPSREPTTDSTEGALQTDADLHKFPTKAVAPSSVDSRSRRTLLSNGRKLAHNVHVRTPSTLRSPMRSANNHNHRYAFRPLTPTQATPQTASLATAALVSPRPQMQRSYSGGAPRITQSASLSSVIGPVPKSAKRWARSAHLHEVKSLASDLSKMNGTSFTEITPRPSTPPPAPVANGASTEPTTPNPPPPVQVVGDVFSSHVLTPPVATVPWTPSSNRKESLTMHLARAGLSPSDMSPSRIHARSADRDGDISEGDAWVDTDVDSSDGGI